MPETTIHRASTPDDYALFGELVREYIAGLGFDVDFQDVESELANLSGQYGPQVRGVALIATSADGQAIGITGVRQLDANVGELKRMYVRPDWQGRGTGSSLCAAAIAEAKALGYRALRLDTLERMPGALAIYESAGFKRIAPYRENPLHNAVFLELLL